MKMRAAYEQNPSMGDPNSVDSQLNENAHKFEKLQSELRKFTGYLSEVDGKPVTPHVQKRHNRNSVSEDSLSRSASDSSVGHNPIANQIAANSNCKLNSSNNSNHTNSDSKSANSRASPSPETNNTNG